MLVIDSRALVATAFGPFRQNGFAAERKEAFLPQCSARDCRSNEIDSPWRGFRKRANENQQIRSSKNDVFFTRIIPCRGWSGKGVVGVELYQHVGVRSGCRAYTACSEQVVVQLEYNRAVIGRLVYRCRTTRMSARRHWEERQRRSCHKISKHGVCMYDIQRWSCWFLFRCRPKTLQSTDWCRYVCRQRVRVESNAN